MYGNDNHFEGTYGKLNPQQEASRFEAYVIDGGRSFFMDLYVIEEVYEFYLFHNQRQKALQLLEFALEQHPYVPDLFYKKSCLDFELERFSSAIGAINQALALRPNECCFMILKARAFTQLEQYNLAIEILYDALDVASEPAPVYYQIGQVYLLMQNYHQAVRFYAQALTLCPDLEAALYECVSAFRLMNDLKGGIAFCEEHINNRPYDHHAWYNLGLMQFDLGLFELSIDAFDYSTIIVSDFILGYQCKARGYASLQKYEQAINHLIESLHYDKNNPVTLLLLGECYEQIKKTDRARRYYHECTQCHPNIAQGWYGVGATWEQEGSYYQAIYYYKQSINLDAQYYDAWLGLADCEYAIGNELSAFEALKTAIELNPDDISLWVDWANKLDKDDNTDGAVLMLEEGIRQHPHTVELLYRYAAYLLKIGRTREGFSYLENALLMDFDKHTILYNICPQVANLIPIQEIIEQYRPFKA